MIALDLDDGLGLDRGERSASCARARARACMCVCALSYLPMTSNAACFYLPFTPNASCMPHFGGYIHHSGSPNDQTALPIFVASVFWGVVWGRTNIKLVSRELMHSYTDICIDETHTHTHIHRYIYYMAHKTPCTHIYINFSMESNFKFIATYQTK